MGTISENAMNSVTVHHAEVNTPNEIRDVLRDFLEDNEYIKLLVRKFSYELKYHRRVYFPLDNSPENLTSLVFIRGAK